ncbi:hypothetical protein HK103_000123 [Boothiomyces macroporosus]|uniref:Rieske domain-containing protein n=1 Tax=Boothiomyces macroporosus TaxID=261099 RepID=A0AAD5UMZ5_9FUNG|nr:hypothetical protein HK103_000123 [Boothiomyces macroporosus]
MLQVLQPESLEQKEKNYELQLEQYHKEIKDIQAGAHPELKNSIELLEIEYNEALLEAEVLKKYQLECSQKVYELERDLCIQEYRGLQEEMLEQLEARKRKLKEDRESFDLGNDGSIDTFKPATRKTTRNGSKLEERKEKRRKPQIQATINLLLKDNEVIDDLNLIRKRRLEFPDLGFSGKILTINSKRTALGTMLDSKVAPADETQINVDQGTDQEHARKLFFEESIDMRKAWYPIFPSEEITSKAPTGFHILGDPIVLYRDPQTQTAVAFADKCAHRSAPLSVGQIMDGKLECRYHGWQYDIDGACSKIPSLLEGRKIPANAKVRKYPTVESDGWVWIWPGNIQDSQACPKPSFPTYWENFDMTPTVQYIDLDIDGSLLMENFLDPSHIPFTHAGTIGKRSMATPLKMNFEFHPDKIVGKSETPERKDDSENYFVFRAPHNVTVAFRDPKQPNMKMDQLFYGIPTTKGHCRFILVQRFGFLQKLEAIPLMRWILKSSFEKYNKKIVMEDYAMLKGQQDRLAAGANAMNSPVAADLMIKTYRNWWRAAMKKKPWFAGYSNDIEDIVLDGCNGC